VWEISSGHAAGLLLGLLGLPVAAGLLFSIRLAGGLGLPAAARWVRAYRSASGARRLAALLLAVTSGVHLGLVAGHLTQQPLQSALFLADGVAFGLLSLVSFTARRWRPAATLLLVANVLGYLVFVIAGWEGPDQVGVATKLLEIIALGLVLVPTPHEAGPFPRRARWTLVAAGVPALVVIVGASVWVVDIARPDARHQHVGALLQSSNRVATPEQQAAAQRLWEDTRNSIAPYQDSRAAWAAGYRPSLEDGQKTVHWTNDAYDREAYILDVRHPQALVYVRSRHGLVLAGAMYQMPRQDQFGPDPGGPLTAWHIHHHICFGLGAFSLATPFSSCPFGMVDVSAPAMLHVWIVGNPRGGPFAIDLDPEVEARLARS
jgi:hypothetical protein